jgi:hypothetical protein
MSSAFKNFVSRRGPWVVVGLTLLLVLVVRVRLREMLLERDEGEYAYAGQLMLQGVPPYQEVYNMKLPGTYAAYAAIMAVFGQTPAGIHLGVMLVNLASIVLVFLLGRKLLDEVTGAVAAVVFGLMSLSPYVLGLAGHATHFVTFFALAGILVLLKALDAAPRPSTLNSELSTLFASGLLFGLSFLMKQHGILFGLFGLLYLGWTWFQARLERPDETVAADGSRRTFPRSQESQKSAPTAVGGYGSLYPPRTLSRPRYQLSTLVYQLTCFSAGFLLPYAATVLMLWAAGVLPQFWFWTVSYAATYASSISAVYSGDMLRNGLRAVVGPNLGLWLLPWAGALVMWWEERLDEGSLRSRVQSPQSVVSGRSSCIAHPRFFLTALLFCSFGSISVGFYFREHYFITLLPVLALLSGVAVSRALHLLRHDRTIELFLALPILLLLVVGLGGVLLGNSGCWFDLSPDEAGKRCYGTSLFSEAAHAGDYLRTNTPPSARIAVLGSEPEVLFYAGRRSATGYIYTYPLMEERAFASTMQQRMIEEIERANPDYAVYVDDRSSWLPEAHSDRRIVDWWNAYWPANMDVVLTRAIQGEAELIPQTSPEPKPPDRPPERRFLIVLKRKSR